MFDFIGWLKVALPVAGAVVPLCMAIVQFSGKLGASGKTQLAISGGAGLVLGVFASIAFFGVPSSVLDYFLMIVFGLMIAGGATGTYEAIKHAASKA